jgi:hypothetical protein
MARPFAIAAVSTIVGFAVLAVVNILPQRGQQHDRNDPQTLQELIFIYHGTCYHVHHFMFMLPLIGVLWTHKLGNEALYATSGFLLGASLEDLYWGDWFKIRNNCHLGTVERLPHDS